MKEISWLPFIYYIEAYKSISKYLDNPYSKDMVNEIYSSELQLNKANASNTEAPFLDFRLSIFNRFVSSHFW